jgi:hypothetical protein
VPAAAIAAAVPATAPTASAMEIAALELLLADPLHRELLAAQGAPANLGTSPAALWLVQHYGGELAGRLQQLAQAHDGVRQAWLRALNDAAARPGPGVPGSVHVPAHWPGGDTSIEPERWDFDPAAFTADYAAGSSLMQRAFAALHAQGQAAWHTEVQHGEAGCGTTHSLSGGLVLAGGHWGWHDLGGSHALRAWQPYTLLAAPGQVNPAAPPRLHQHEALWFDPVLGWATDPANVVQRNSLLDRLVPAAFVIGATALSGGALGLSGAATSLTGAVGSGAAMGALGAAWGGLVNNGRLDLRDIVRGAFGGAVTAGVVRGTGLGSAGLNGAGQVGSYALRALALTGQATLQGALQELLGGRFRDGFTSGLASGLATEVSRALNAGIDTRLHSGQLSSAEASQLRLLARAAGSAVHALAHPQDPAFGFAHSLLRELIVDGVQAAAPRPQAPVLALLLDDQGLPLPGAVDTTLAPLQQALQLAQGLQARGMDPELAVQQAMNAVGAAVVPGLPSPASNDGWAAPDLSIVIDGRALERDALGNRYETDAQGRTLVHLAGGGLLALGQGQAALSRVGDRVVPGMGLLRSMAQLANPAWAAASLLFVPGNAGQIERFELGQGDVFERRPGELYGRHLRYFDDTGRWEVVQPHALGIELEAGFAVLTDEQLQRLR